MMRGVCEVCGQVAEYCDSVPDPSQSAGHHDFRRRNSNRMSPRHEVRKVEGQNDDRSDVDQNNPVEADADDWRQIYSDMGDEADDFIDRDESMNG